MKAVLISIRPRRCALITSGRETAEVRKTRPKMETPFRCYIYCTTGNPHDPHQRLELHTEDGKIHLMNGIVIGEFVCDRIYQYTTGGCTDGMDITTEEATKMSCLTYEELRRYELKAEPKENCIYMVGLYCWHITDLKIYNKPKNLSEFYIWKKCNSCRASGYESSACIYDEDCRVPAVITRPPQSWCYVEEARNAE